VLRIKKVYLVLAVEVGKFKMSGLVINEETKNVEHNGCRRKSGYLTSIKTITADDSTPQGSPGATAIKTKYRVCNDIEKINNAWKRKH
jgi:hypothetical protein